MRLDGYSSVKNFRFELLLLFVVVFGTSLVISVASAEEENMTIGANVSAKINVDKSGVHANTSGNESTKVEGNAGSSSNAKPQEGYHENAQAQSHEHLNAS